MWRLEHPEGSAQDIKPSKSSAAVTPLICDEDGQGSWKPNLDMANADIEFVEAGLNNNRWRYREEDEEKSNREDERSEDCEESHSEGEKSQHGEDRKRG